MKDANMSLNFKKLPILHLVWKINRRLQWKSLCCTMQWILVSFLGDNSSKYGKNIIQSFLGNVITTVILESKFCVKILSCICQPH